MVAFEVPEVGFEEVYMLLTYLKCVLRMYLLLKYLKVLAFEVPEVDFEEVLDFDVPTCF
jgi:hypothetical protein